MSKPPAPSRVADQFLLRFPGNMRDMISRAADASGRSMNTEIVMRLMSTFDTSDSPDLTTNVREIAAKRDAALSSLALLHTLYSNLASTAHDMCKLVQPKDERGAGMLALLERMTEQVLTKTEAPLDVIQVMDEGAARYWKAQEEARKTGPNMGNPIIEPPPSGVEQPDNPTPKVKPKRMVMRRQLKD